MNGILLDINIQGDFAHVLHLLAAQDLLAHWESGGFVVRTLADLGLAGNTPDRTIWNRCQAEGLVLFTENRNDDGPDSLERTIADSLTPDSLPVLTVSNKQRFRNDRRYALVVAERFVETILDIDDGRLLGVGRLFLPPRTVV